MHRLLILAVTAFPAQVYSSSPARGRVAVIVVSCGRVASADERSPAPLMLRLRLLR